MEHNSVRRGYKGQAPSAPSALVNPLRCRILWASLSARAEIRLRNSQIDENRLSVDHC
jgi:hypothetical protein